jgi:deoxyadenosine/deoxycytidine kinase
MSKDRTVINIYAPIGVGKSSLTEIISKEWGMKQFQETVNDKVLQEFYTDRKNKSFLLQISFLTDRFEQFKKAIAHGWSVQDSGIYSDSLMFQNLCDRGEATEAEYEVYFNLLQSMQEELPLASQTKQPTLTVYLEASFENMLSNIQKRGRDYENFENNPELIEYFKGVHKQYKNWYSHYNYSPKMKINVDNLDFVNNEDDKEYVLNLIKERLQTIKELN